ncbi:MAG: hypothetical protein ACIAXF_13805 [Phycisphaerales bacterium JB063]
MEDIPEGNPMHSHDPTAPPPPPPPAGMQGGGYPAGPAPTQGPPGGRIPKPGKLQAIAIIMLISGIINCLYSLYYLVLAPFTMCLSLIALPLILTAGIMEIVHASKLLKDPITVYKPATGIAVLEICCVLLCSMFSVVAGILALVFWSDPEVKQYYRDVALARGFQPQV